MLQTTYPYYYRFHCNAEKIIWKHLRGKRLEGFKFRRQEPIGNYVADFVCYKKRIVVELDGGQHLDAEEYDNERTHYLNCSGIQVIRFWNNDVLQKTDIVIEVIWQHLTKGVGGNNSP